MADSKDRPADLVIVGAKIWTGASATRNAAGQPSDPTALAVLGDTIAAVGTDLTIRSHMGPDTKVVNANGRRVIPGITDSHTHLVN